MYSYSLEHKDYLKKIKRKKIIITVFQILIISLFIIIWESLARTNLINTFLSSSPTEVIKTTINLFKTNNLFNHIWVTLYETLISFLIASIFGFIIASILWWNDILAKIIDPYLTILNSLPKVALGPLIIIWVGANTNSIIFMALMISLIISIINIYNGFINTPKNYIKLMQSFQASKWNIYKKAVVPSNINNIINCFKINISMSLIGVIMGELLVSKEGLGYLIMYGSQVFNINLVITSVVILGIISYLMYKAVNYLEIKVKNR